MRKLFVFLFFFVFCLEVCNAQKPGNLFHDAGFYNTIQWSAHESAIITPQAWIYIKSYYLEARYNYENQKTASLYFGKSFLFLQDSAIEITPIVGGVFGKTNGISPGFNFQAEHKRFSTFTQCQYTIDLKNISNSFFWDWSGFNVKISDHWGSGGSVQVFLPNNGEPFYHIGPMISFHHKTFVLEIYAYNFWQHQAIGAIGIQYEFR